MKAKRWFQCGRKARYKTRELAQTVIDKVGDPSMHAYHCPHCAKFHIGHHKAKGYLKDWLRGEYEIG